MFWNERLSLTDMQAADDKLRKRKKYFGEKKKIDTFRSPTRELILDACHFVDKTRKAAGQWNNRTFPFSSRLHSFFFNRSIFFVPLNLCMKIIQNNLCKAFFTIWWILCWKLFDEKFLKTILKTYIVLRFTSTNVPYFWFWIVKKKCSRKRSFWTQRRYCTKLRGFFLRIKNTVSYKRSTWGIAL